MFGLSISHHSIDRLGSDFNVINRSAERFNGLMAMNGIAAGIGEYAMTGQIITGIF